MENKNKNSLASLVRSFLILFILVCWSFTFKSILDSYIENLYQFNFFILLILGTIFFYIFESKDYKNLKIIYYLEKLYLYIMKRKIIFILAFPLPSYIFSLISFLSD